MSLDLIEEPFEDCCRTCLSHRKPVTQLKELCKRTSELRVILNFMQIKVINNDAYPNQICEICFDQLKSFQQFKEQSQKSLQTLKETINAQKVKIEDEKSEEIEDKKNIEKEVESLVEDFKEENSLDGCASIPDDCFDPCSSEHDNPRINDFLKQEIITGTVPLVLPPEDKPKKRRRRGGVKKDKSSVTTRGGLCLICKKVISNLKRHNIYKHGDPDQRPKFSCIECNIMFDHAKSLYIHKKRIHEKTLTKETCEQCGTSVFHLAIHMKNIHSNIKFDCPHCDKSFKGKHSLKAHIDFVHENPNQLPKVLCQICGAAFKRNSELNKHLQARHSDARNYKCGFCERTFKTSSQTKVHERTAHSTIRPFACTYCPNAFALKKTLTNHMRIHTGEKPFVCQFCSKAFTQKTTMLTHIKLIHAKE